MIYLGKVNLIKKLFSKTRRVVLGDYREEQLCKIICNDLDYDLSNFKKKIFKIVDYGSGYNPVLIKKIINRLSKKYKKISFKAYCYDFYEAKQIKTLNKNKKIIFQQIHKFKNPKIKKYDLCLLIDVIHHIGLQNEKKIIKILNLLKTKSNLILIKDHFQFGFFSNLLLILMDFLGNYGDGTSIPYKYFTEKNYKYLINKSKLKIIKIIKNIKLYKWFWIFINNPRLQFISILK